MDNGNPFLHALASYREAVRAKDVDALSELYDPDVHVFDMWGTWSVRGLPAWRELAANWFSSLGAERVAVTCDSESSTVTGDMAIGHAVLTYTAIGPDGTRIRSLSNRATLALRKKGDSWKIFHEHTSAPIDHQTLQAILQRSDG